MIRLTLGNIKKKQLSNSKNQYLVDILMLSICHFHDKGWDVVQTKNDIITYIKIT